MAMAAGGQSGQQSEPLAVHRGRVECSTLIASLRGRGNNVPRNESRLRWPMRHRDRSSSGSNHASTCMLEGARGEMFVQQPAGCE